MNIKDSLNGNCGMVIVGWWFKLFYKDNHLEQNLKAPQVIYDSIIIMFSFILKKRNIRSLVTLNMFC